jgi:Na+/H+-dicarboxylate symporter
MATVLNPIGRAYVRLLQMAIVPYITVSLIAGLGRLTPQQASRIALWGGLVLLLILIVGMVLVLLVPLAYPDWEAANYFSSSLVSSSSSVDFVSLYISANPFYALANTVVPAIVLFSIVMGVAVMRSERKGPLLELLASVDDALMNITRFMVKLAPIGIFAITANAAGTLDVTAFDKLQVYIWTYILLWALLFFVFLPGLLVALTPIRYGELFAAFRIAFITAFVTGSVLVVLPMIIEGINKLLANRDIGDEETDAAVDVLIPTTFNFPSVAMLLVLSYRVRQPRSCQ